MDKAIIILSGGLDSTTLLYSRTNYNLFALSFDYGQKHIKELEFARWHCEKLGITHTIINISFLKDLIGSSSALTSQDIQIPNIKEVLGHPQPLTYVPFRNQIFLTLALCYAESIEAKKVFYGAQRHDLYSYWDTTEEFVKRINDIASLNRFHQIEIVTPFVTFKKSDIIKLGLELSVDYSKTWSCYNGQNKPCMTCPTCAERIKAFQDLNMIDPLLQGD